MVRKGFSISKQGSFILIIVSFFYVYSFIKLYCPNALAQAIADDDYLEVLNGIENDKYKNAIDVEPNKYINLSCQDDDWYKVNIPDLGEITTTNIKVTIQFFHRDGDLDLTLYSIKAPPNDYNFLDISGLAANEEVVSASVPPGDYLIRVYGYNGVKNNYTMNIEILYPCQYVTYDWIEITNGEKALPLEDDDYEEIPIGFDFKFYNQIYNKVKVSSNGYLTFAEQTDPYFNPDSPTPIRAIHRDAPPISIFSYWMDLRPDLGGGIFFKTDDQSNPECKKLIVEWRDIPKDSTGEAITFQAVLFECTNQIMLQYQDVIFSSQNDGYSLGRGATVGIANGRKTTNSINRIATQYLYKNEGLTQNAALMFTPSLHESIKILSGNIIGEGLQPLQSNQEIRILFNQFIDENTLKGSLSINPYINGDWVINKNQIVFDHPGNPFDYTLSYVVTIVADQLRDCFGNELSDDAHYTFSVKDEDLPEIEVSTTSISFGDVLINETSNPMEMFIFNRGNADLNVSGLTLSDNTNFYLNLNGGSNPLGNPPAIIPKKENRSIAFTFTPDSEKNFNSSLTINSNDLDNSIISVSLSGKGVPKPQPDISISPENLDFGIMKVGISSTQILTISNNGNAELNIKSLTLQGQDGGNFSLDLTGGSNPLGNLPAIIPKGKKRTITVNFTSSGEYTFENTLDIISDDPDTPKIEVLFQGTGISPIGWTNYDQDICFGSDNCLTDSKITALMLDANKTTLWIGTREGGICSYNLYNGELSCFDQGKGLAGNNVIDIAMGPQGELWVATAVDINGNGQRVSLFNRSSERFESYNIAQMDIHYDLWISEIAVDNNSNLWIATQGSGLFEFDGSVWNNYNVADDEIISINVDSSGRVWIGTLNTGLFVKQPSANPKRINFNLGEYISEIAVDTDGNLWILSILDNKNSLIFSSPDSLILPGAGGLSPESIYVPDDLAKIDIVINDIFIHPGTGNLFIASDNGFYFYDGETWEHFTPTNSDLASLYVNRIIVDPYNDNWIGTEEGLSHFNSAAPYIVGVIYGNENKTYKLSIETSIYVNFSEPMDRRSTEDFFEMTNLDQNRSLVKGTFHWNENSTVIKFEPNPSLAYNSNYEIRIYKEVSDRAGMAIDLNVCEGDDYYCSFFISTEEKPYIKPDTTDKKNWGLFGGLFGNYYPPYTYNTSLYTYNTYGLNHSLPYGSGYSTGNSLLRISSNNYNLQYKVNPYSNYQNMRVPQAQTNPLNNFSTWNSFSPSYYINYINFSSYTNSNFSSYTNNIYQTYRSSLQGLYNYSNSYQNRFQTNYFNGQRGFIKSF